MQRGVEQQVGDDLLHQRGVGAEERQVGGQGRLERVVREGLAHAVERGVEEVVGVAPVEPGPERAGLEARLVEEIVDEAVEPAGGGADLAGEGGARRLVGGGEVFHGGVEHGERRLQLVRHAVEQRAVQFLRLGQEFFPLARGAELLALDDEGELRGEALRQVALGERQRGLGCHAHDEHADGGVLAHEWQIKSLGGGQGVGEAAGLLAIAPGPVRDAARLLGQGIRAREVRGQPGAAVTEQQGGLRREERIGLAQRREHRVIERARGAERLREAKKRGGPVLAPPLVALLRADAGGELAGDQRDHEVGDEHHAILEFSDDEGEDRRDEEEIPSERAYDARDEYGPAADAQAQGDDGQQIEQPD